MANISKEISYRIKKKLKFYRQDAKLTQTQLALKTGFSLDYISAIEQGKRFPSIHSLCKIADVLNVDPHEFLKP